MIQLVKRLAKMNGAQPTGRGRFGSVEASQADQKVGRVFPGEQTGADRQTQRFTQIVFVVRAATTIIALGLISTSTVDHGPAVLVWAAVLTAYNVLRLIRPLEGRGDTVNVVRVLFEIALHSVAAALTGAWSSPFVFPLIPAIIVAGFGRGIWPALRISLTTAIAISAVEVIRYSDNVDLWVLNLQWTIFLALVGVMAGYARRILGDARTTHSIAMNRVASLTDANRLLTSLHNVAQVLPASLDLDEVLDSMVNRLRALFDYDAAVLLLLDETDGSWQVARWDGHRLDGALEPSRLPAILRQVRRDLSVRCVDNLGDHGGGLVPKLNSGLYGPLVARGEFVGLVALEAAGEARYGNRDARLLGGFLEPASLAVANAQVFERLRTVGADEERTRIARDLHDRIGQSLAYVAFELDRLVKGHEEGRDLGPPLQQLRHDVRGVIGEVRDTLYDLRTDVSDEQDFVATMREFLERVQKRSGLKVEFSTRVRGRMPILPERELWRIAQEAVINVERHAAAKCVRVTWQTDGQSARMEIADDGVGFPDGSAGRLDSYGILGMRERAASVGATLQITGAPQRGTVVRCRLDAR